MGKIGEPEKAVPVCGLIYAEGFYDEARKAAQSKLGSVVMESPVYDFTFTDYYREEMGEGLKRLWWVFGKRIDQSELPELKIWSNKIEERFTAGGRRRVNIDPGYLSHAKLVLATTKDFAHRIYLKDGIYAEITLTYVNDSYRPNPWTYPDYKSRETLEFFNNARKERLRKART